MIRRLRDAFNLLLVWGVVAWWILMLLSPVRASCMESREVGVINVDRLNMRTAPGLSYPVIKVLGRDTRVRVMAHTGEWLKVDHEGDVGFISGSSEYVSIYTIHTITDDHRTDLETAREKAEGIHQEIKAKESDLSAFSRQEKQILSRMQEIDVQLNRTRREASEIKTELAVTATGLADLEVDVASLQKEIDAGREYAIKRMTALYKLNMLGEMNLLASATSLSDLMKQQSAMERILSRDYSLISKLVGRKEKQAALLHRLSTEKARMQDLQNDYAATIARLAAEKKERESVLLEIKTQKTNRMAAIKYLKQAALHLDQTISQLSTPAPDVKNKTSFAAYQGLLKKPVEGKVTFSYGKYVDPQSGVANFHNGIEIQAERGAPVRAVFSGQTIFSSWLKGYGNVIIIAHGDSYHTVYAHADELFRAKGERVEAGEVIATVGDTGALNGPSLYFEIRCHGNPVDPLKWINNS